MALFSLSNFVLKGAVTGARLDKLDSTSLIGTAVLLAAAISLAYLFFLKPALPVEVLAPVLFVVLVASAGFLFNIKALEGGKVALVSAILSLSTLGVAALSYALMGDRFSVKELAAIGLAVASVVLLVL